MYVFTKQVGQHYQKLFFWSFEKIDNLLKSKIQNALL
jgi:hypothetical protein